MLKSDEKRSRNRLLCSEGFSKTQLRVSHIEFSLVSVNYNRRGIGLFSSDRLPEHQDCELSFEFQGAQGVIVIASLAALIRHRNETEVGHQYGIEFRPDNSQLSSQELALLSQALIDIEQELSLAEDPENRWGVF